MKVTRLGRLAPALAVAALVAACADQPTPFAPTLAPSAPSLAVTGKPNLNDRGSFEGELWVCKDGTPSAVSFNFDYVVTNASDGSTVASGTVAVPMGQCVMAASTGTAGGGFNASVTEQTPLAADWALTSIVAEFPSGINNPMVPVVNVVSYNVSNVRINNDWGAVVTFTNTYTPPPPPSYCTLTQGYWKNHTEDWDSGQNYVDSGDIFYNSGKTYIEIMNTPPKGGNAYLQLAHQFIAASLNVGGTSGSGIAAVDAALAGADAYFAAAAAGIPAPTGATKTQLQAWASTLGSFNEGLTGPGHCN
ncbi:MAG TPA: hypothetical protein PKC83_09415 [Gemmatimonadaceae bacterium]|nr:MAG: hypothetical protein ABS52_06545 [Gemmatimonadetes bacterium SCN 70-22]HMN08989.1 hypothetical protein [Gemmatimonadaceae bacterium]